MKKYSLGLYEKAMPNDKSIVEKLNLAKAAGYDYIELSIDETDAKLARLEMTKEEKNEILAGISETGIYIGSICLSGHRKYPLGHEDESVQKRSLEIMQKAIDLAVYLKVRIIQLAGYDVYYEQGNAKTIANFKKNLAKCAEMASAKGVVLGFETMETPFMNTCAKSMEYVSTVNSPYLGVYPDAGNLNNAAILYETDVCEDIKTASGHIFAMHLKDTVPDVYRDMMFGDGVVNFDRVCKTALSLGVRMFVTEFWYLGSEDWKDDLKKANDFARGVLERNF